MQNRIAFLLAIFSLAASSSCSPRDFLSRRLAADLIAASASFKATQAIQLRTGIVSNQDYLSSESITLRRHGWATATTAACPAGTSPAPCWDVVLTPSGVDTVRTLVSPEEARRSAVSVPAATRELVEVTGISKQGNQAEVEFVWRWLPLNEIGAAFYAGETHYRSETVFRNYDDGWRVVETSSPQGQFLEGALKNAVPVH